MMRRSAVAFALALLVLMPLASVHAQRLPGGGSGAVLLRYHFAAGQTIVFQVRATITAVTGIAGAPPAATTIRGTIRAQEHVLGVDAAGVATVALSLVTFTYTATVAGGTTRRMLAPRTLGTATIAPDGHEHGAAGITSLIVTSAAGPTFPAEPVAPGARWSTQESGILAAGPGMTPATLHLTTTSTLLGYGLADGEPVAIIDDMAPLHFAGDIVVAHSSVHVVETGVVTQRFLFGLDSGQPIAGTEREDAEVATQPVSTLGTASAVRTHVVEQASLQRVSL